MSRVRNDLLSVYRKETPELEYIAWLNERINTTLDILVLLSIDTEEYIRRVTDSKEEAKRYLENSGVMKVNESILMLSGMTIEQVKEQ